MWAKAGTIIAVIAALVGIITGFVSFSNNYVHKEVFEAKVEKVEIELAGALSDFRDDFKQERLQRQEDDLRLNTHQLQLQEEVIIDKLKLLEKNPKKDDYHIEYLERQLNRTRKQNERTNDVLIEIQKRK